MDGFIYLWENKLNGKKYLGSHIGTTNDGYIGSGTIFNRALRKYGAENFERTIIEFVSKETVLEREQHYLDLYNAANSNDFYNVSPQAGGGWEYVNSDPTIRQKVIMANKNLWTDKEHPRGMLGKQHTKESWDKTRSGWKDWADRHLKRPVLQYTLDGELVQEYESITAAAKAVKGNPSNIKYTIEGKYKKAYGHKWSYKEDINE